MKFLLLSLIILCGCLPRGDADLVWQSDNLIDDDTISINDGYYTIIAWVKNVGSQPSGECVIEIMVNGFHFMKVSFPSLESNERAQVIFDLWTDDLTVGTYTIKAILDADNQVGEINESNNVISDKLNVVSAVVTPEGVN